MIRCLVKMIYVSLKHDISLVYVIAIVFFAYDVYVLICYMLHVDTVDIVVSI